MGQRRVSAFQFVVLAAVSASAQAPPYAVILNPTVPGLTGSRCAQSGNRVHALGVAPTTPFANTALYARSLDGGRTWPLREVPLGPSGQIGLGADGDTVVALLGANANGPIEVHSGDGGSTWSAPRGIGTAGGLPTNEVALHLRGTMANVVWNAFRPGSGWLWVNRSTDGGATWQPTDLRLDNSNPINAQTDTRLQLFGDGSNLHVFWAQNDNGLVFTRYQRSTDGGATWLPAPQNLGPGRALGIVVSGGQLLVGTPSMVRSIDNGTTWNPVPGPSLYSPVIGGEGQNVIAAAPSVATFGANRFSFTILVDTSVDGGQTWRAAPVQAFPPLPTVGYPDATVRPFVVGDSWYLQISNSNLFVVPPSLRQSVDQGTTWRSVANRYESYWPSASRIVAIIEQYPYVYAHVLAGHSVVGAGSIGTGGIEPTLAGTGIPGPGLTFSLRVAGTRGASLGLLGLALGAPVLIPLGSATLYLPAPIVNVVSATGGSAGQPGSGAFATAITVPVSTAFSGLELVSQAFILDPGAVDGFAATAGLLSRLH